MKLVEGKLYETKIWPSQYPGCEIEVLYAPVDQVGDYYKVSEKQIYLLQSILESCYVQCTRLDEIIESMTPPLKVD